MDFINTSHFVKNKFPKKPKISGHQSNVTPSVGTEKQVYAKNPWSSMSGRSILANDTAVSKGSKKITSRYQH